MEFIHADVFWGICLVRGFYYAIFTCHHSNSCCIIFVSSQQKYWNNRRSEYSVFLWHLLEGLSCGFWSIVIWVRCLVSIWPLWVMLDLREVLVRVFILDSFMNPCVPNVNWGSLQIHLHTFCLPFLSLLPPLYVFDVSLNKVCHLGRLFVPQGRLRHARCSVYLESCRNVRLLWVHFLIYFGSWHEGEIAAIFFFQENSEVLKQTFSLTRDVTNYFNLSPGTYAVIPATTDDQEFEFLLRIFVKNQDYNE